MPATRLHFVRHGQSTWNLAGRAQGQTSHVPLTPTGRRQARAAATALAGFDARLLLTSDLVRARQTAEILAHELRLPATPEPALREQSLGSLEGRLAADLAPEHPPRDVPVSAVRWGGGESVADVHARVGGLLRRLLVAGPPREVVLVSHGETIRVAVAYLRGLGPHEVDWFALPNGAVVTVQPHPGGTCSTSTATGHLDATP